MAGVSGKQPAKKRGSGRPFVKGQSGNPAGYSKARAEFADLLNARLREPEFFAAWSAAYRLHLNKGTELIVKDYADRVGGKAVDRVAMTDADGKDVAPKRDYSHLSVEELRQLHDLLDRGR